MMAHKTNEEAQREKREKYKEAQETAARLKFEQEIKRKSEQWVNTSFFLKIANSVVIDINKYIESARTIKIGRNECDSLLIICNMLYVEVSTLRSLNYFDHRVLYRELGFEDLDGDDINIASLNLALLLYLEKKYQTMPEIVLSFCGNKSIAECISIHDGQPQCTWPHIECNVTKIHPLLEKITIP